MLCHSPICCTWSKARCVSGMPEPGQNCPHCRVLRQRELPRRMSSNTWMSLISSGHNGTATRSITRPNVSVSSSRWPPPSGLFLRSRKISLNWILGNHSNLPVAAVSMTSSRIARLCSDETLKLLLQMFSDNFLSWGQCLQIIKQRLPNAPSKKYCTEASLRLYCC